MLEGGSMLEGLEVISGASVLGDLGVISGEGFVEEGWAGLRPSENKSLVCFREVALRGWLKCVACPCLLSVQLRVLCDITSFLGLLIADDDVDDGINHGDFGDDSARRPPTLTSLTIGWRMMGGQPPARRESGSQRLVFRAYRIKDGVNWLWFDIKQCTRLKTQIEQ